MPDLAPGDVVTGVVEQIMPYGAFVRLQSGQKAMIHISQLSHKFIKSVDAVLQPQQEIKAKVIKIDERGRIDLSLKALEEPPAVPVQRMPRHMPAAGSNDEAVGSDDFEKKLSTFLKSSEEKISSLMNAKSGKGGRPPRRKGARP
ncbi:MULTISPECIES: S1 RNA-binding domain-containing protein [unclassified Pyramidobacter]|uniref:S1 RNA-binding domain-containing protein n=1 Tax=unclassified Pyramidobacter TaxID=2632171 RepID=UPI00098F6795|nr:MULTISPECIES: S1 RNA-binding domain-containing protein [unclassified Pyramidobacter]MCI7403723.1 S1 RNA-binding domain-containing protein [Pyramidobacter sp.]MDY3212541.1 S1 RNA-binding domain-containing protein [Pyramidobacter sp.]OON87776.1 general stress protein [Pyramidobacter sp. C12-8]RKJ77290.1 S1 RNA-binding domain-containing protein [Pyramidobacter sp. CG50-2]